MTFRFHGLLKRVEREEYAATLKKYAGSLEGEEGVKAVYQAGSVRHPGISDLDVLVVLGNEPKRFTWKRHSFTRMDSLSQYIMMHEPFVVSESLATQTASIYPLSSLTRVEGKKIKFKPRPVGDALPFMVQEAVLGYLFWPHRTIARKAIDWRTILPQLGATKYEAESFEKACGRLDQPERKKLKALLLKTERIKKDIFKKPLSESEGEVARLVFLAKEIHDAMLGRISDRLEEAGASPKKRIYFGLKPKVLVFGGDGFSESRLVRALPATFAAILNEKTASTIRDRDVRAAFLNRVRRINAYEKFVFSNRLQKFMMLTQLHTKVF